MTKQSKKFKTYWNALWVIQNYFMVKDQQKIENYILARMYRSVLKKLDKNVKVLAGGFSINNKRLTASLRETAISKHEMRRMFNANADRVLRRNGSTDFSVKAIDEITDGAWQKYFEGLFRR